MFLVPIGRSLTQQEEKNDVRDFSAFFFAFYDFGTYCYRWDSQAEEDSDESEGSAGAPSVAEDEGENESAQDLDASMEDLDEEATGNMEEESMAEGDSMAEGEAEEYEEEPSDM